MYNKGCSVIIPAYNAEKTIEKAVLSVADDEHCFEVIVVNDGSTDNTGKIVSELNKVHSKIKLIECENGGVSKARNIGIKNATGNYIFFLDADDYLSEKSISFLYKISVENNLDMCCTNIVEEKSIKSKDNKCAKIEKNEIYNEENIIKAFEKIEFRAIWGKFIKAEIIKDNNIFFKENISYGEDTEFAINILKTVKNIGLCHNSTYNVQNVNLFSLSKIYNANFDKSSDFKNKALMHLFEIYPEFENEYFKTRIGIKWFKFISFCDNLFRFNSPYKFNVAKQEIKIKLKEFIKTDEFLHPTKLQLPKKRIEKFYYMIIKTKSAFLIALMFWCKNFIRKNYYSK